MVVKKKNNSITRQSGPPELPWPDEVYVITKSQFNITGEPGCDSSNWPRTLIGSMQAEIRQSIQMMYVYSNMIDVWMDAYKKVHLVYLKHTTKFDQYDHYNATWAALGYTDDQCPRAIELLKLAESTYKCSYPFIAVSSVSKSKTKRTK